MPTRCAFPCDVGTKHFRTLYDFQRWGMSIHLSCANPPCPHRAVLAPFLTCRWARLWRWPQAIEAGVLYHFRCSRCGARNPRIAPIEAAATHDWFPDERGRKLLERRLRG